MGTTALGNKGQGIRLNGTHTGTTIGGTTPETRNVISKNFGDGINLADSATDAIIQGNYIGLSRAGVAGFGNGRDGINMGATTSAAILGNLFHGNNGQAIDLDGDDITVNDVGDVDSGANDLLNFPVINSLTVDGTTSVMYNVNLDVPANTEGYRIEFYRNTTGASVVESGEGEEFLGFSDTGNHAGGSVNFSGSFTASAAVSLDDIISTTATRKTGATSYDITSEFSQNAAATGSLAVMNTNDSGIGSLRRAMLNANNSAGMDNVTFEIPGAGPHIISLLSALPIITDSGVNIDGSTQSGASCGQLTTGTQHTLKVRIDGTSAPGSTEAFEIDAANVTIKGLSITNMSGRAVFTNLAGSDNLTLECLYVGVATDGTSKHPNVTTEPGRSSALEPKNLSNLVIRNSLVSGNDSIATDRGIRVRNITGGVIEGNIIGLTANGTAALGNGDQGILITGATTGMTIGGTTAATRNVVSGNGGNGIEIEGGSSNITVLGNYVGLSRTGAAGLGNGGDGVDVAGTSTVAIYENSIHSNGGIGIDLVVGLVGGVTANDNGDSDSGANDLLNFPVFNALTTDGNLSVGYDFDLDVPSNANGYRIDFYKSSAVDASGYGEGEIYLGAVDVAHAGGDLNFAGTFTLNVAVLQGDHISATATRKTGATSYDITSEFSLTTDTGSPTELTAEKSVDVYDPTSLGLYMLPGNDAVSSLTVTNPGASSADTDTIVIIEKIPAETTFYNGDIDDGGPETNPVSFVQTGGAGLTFNYAADVKYSNSVTRPTVMADCNFTPAAGYDSNVTYVCFNPKGAMAAGDPDPTFTIAYRARIK